MRNSAVSCRSRLILVHLLFLGWVVLLSVMSFAIPRSEQDPVLLPDEEYIWWLRAAVFAESMIGAVVLWRSRGLSLLSLRRWEWICFATQAAYHGLYRFAKLASVGATQHEPTVAFAFTGLATLQGFITLVLAYGVLIPNTRRRSLPIVAALTAVPLAVVPRGGRGQPGPAQGHVFPSIVQWAFIMMFPAAITVFAAVSRRGPPSAGVRSRAARRPDRPVCAQAKAGRGGDGRGLARRTRAAETAVCREVHPPRPGGAAL